MYIYEVGYHSYEESCYIQLYHEEKFSGKRFEGMVIKATVALLKREGIRKGERTSFQDILHDVVEELITAFGFKEVKFTAKFGIFGWANILDEKDWRHDRDELLNRLTESIKNEVKFSQKKENI